jgi:hypothetical protein
MNQLILGTSGGNVYMYDLPKALENERLLTNKKLEMGVEDDLVYTYLPRIHINEFNDFLTNHLSGKSKILRQEVSNAINEHISSGH